MNRVEIESLLKRALADLLRRCTATVVKPAGSAARWNRSQRYHYATAFTKAESIVTFFVNKSNEAVSSFISKAR